MSEINFLNILQVIVAVALIIFILIQRGPGATAGSAFGSGASGTVFGAKGSASFLTKTTAILATAFFIITMTIAMNASSQFASTGEEAEQDLGVIGTLDDIDAEPSMESTDPVDGPAADVIMNDNNDPVDTDAATTGDTEPAMSRVDEPMNEAEAATSEAAAEETEEDGGEGN
ncbi:preprotein translocase subunit SecG [Marinicella meishanensis]|uniref:preprotein translocase subunit SecG n=1 Tax=Marinicella meishanensis TaxID=2873263 RepID=UPI001CBDDF2A|nr:preprotein translocase subunit SecG [Marinicella sp. NBU2979]